MDPERVHRMNGRRLCCIDGNKQRHQWVRLEWRKLLGAGAGAGVGD